MKTGHHRIVLNFDKPESDLEIVFSGYSSGNLIWAINPDGSNVEGFPIELGEKVGEHGRSMSKPATLVLPFLIYNLEGSDREEFTSRMPWILKKFIVPVIWKKKWEKMKPFLLT